MTPLCSLQRWPLLLWGCVLGFVVGGGDILYAQTAPSPWTHSATVFAAGSPSGTLPFWLHANRYGIADPQSANAGLRLRTQRAFTDKTGFDYAVGGELIGRTSAHATAYLHELYGQLRYGSFQLTAGRHEQQIGLADSSLSLGNVTWAPNATPPPKVSFSTPDYLSVPGTDNVLGIKGYIAHGWLGEDHFVRNALLHEKYAYLRLLRPEAPVTFHVGMTHHAVWGGTHPRRGPQPSGFRDWLDVVRGQSKSNAAGERIAGINQLASYDLSFNTKVRGLRVRGYRQFYHEDTPSLLLRNPWDGLWGLRLRRADDSKLVSGLLWEHLRMTRHNARFSAGEERGSDTYYHHSTYRGGWTYQGRTLGIPLITTPSTTPGVDDALPGIANSIVVAHHLGIEGTLAPDFSYRLLGTYSRNHGAQGVCETVDCANRVDRRTSRKDQYSLQLMLRGPLLKQHGLWGRATMAADVGAFYEHRMGGSIQVTWRR